MVQSSKYNFSELDAVYTPFIGGYWTWTIRMILSFYILFYCAQLGCYCALGHDVVGRFFAVNRGQDFALWQIFTCCFVHNLIPFDLLTSMAIVAFMAGDLERQWRWALFLTFYYANNMLSSALRYAVDPGFPIYGSLGGSLAVLYVFALRHPQRLVYGKITVKQMTVFGTLFFLFIAYCYCTFYQSLAYLACVPVAFGTIRGLPWLRHKYYLRRLLLETRHIYSLDILREQADGILDKISRQGISHLTPEEQKCLEKAGRKLKKTRRP